MTSKEETDITTIIQRRPQHPRRTGRDQSEQLVAIRRNEWSRSSECAEGSFVALARTRLGEFASAAGGMRDPNDREVELSFWESVRESDNPASLQAYLEKYPDGEFKSLAEIRLSELRVPPISS